MYRSGHNGAHSKCVDPYRDPWVRIPPSPPQMPVNTAFAGIFISRKTACHNTVFSVIKRGEQVLFPLEFLETLVFIGFPRIARTMAQMFGIAPKITNQASFSSSFKVSEAPSLLAFQGLEKSESGRPKCRSKAMEDDILAEKSRWV